MATKKQASKKPPKKTNAQRFKELEERMDEAERNIRNLQPPPPPKDDWQPGER